jgi:hypothetical protein
MTPRLLRDLMAFARETGYDASPCPDCAAPQRARADSETCSNCGGSGRLWTSARGSLSDQGLQRLRAMVDRQIQKLS